MHRTRRLLTLSLSLLAFSVPLGGSPPRVIPCLYLPRFRIVTLVAGDCTDASIKSCEEAEMHLSLLKQKVEDGLASPDESGYMIQGSDQEFTEAEGQLKADWESKGSDPAQRPYIIEAKVTRAGTDGYYVTFRSRLVGDSAWLPARGYPAPTGTLIDLPKKYFPALRQVLARLCQEVVADWKKHNGD